MVSTLDNNSLSSDQYTNQFFDVGGHLTTNLLFIYQKLYRLSYMKPTYFENNLTDENFQTLRVFLQLTKFKDKGWRFFFFFFFWFCFDNHNHWHLCHDPKSIVYVLKHMAKERTHVKPMQIIPHNRIYRAHLDHIKVTE